MPQMSFKPSELFFAHNNINSHFGADDNRNLDDSLKDLLQISERPETVLPKMKVMEFGGKYYVVNGNRRLFLLKQLESAGLVNTVTVNVVPFNKFRFRLAYKTKCGGVSVRIPNDPLMNDKVRRVIEEYQKGKA